MLNVSFFAKQDYSELFFLKSRVGGKGSLANAAYAPSFPGFARLTSTLNKLQANIMHNQFQIE